MAVSLSPSNAMSLVNEKPQTLPQTSADAGATADAVVVAVGVDQRHQAQRRQERAVELPRRGEVGDGERDVGDAVDLHW